MVRIIFVSSFIVLTTLSFYSCEKVICISKEIKPITPTGISSWTPIASPTINTLLDVTFANSTTGYIVGYSGTILKTTDGGTTWIPLNSGITDNLRSIYMFNSSTGFAVGENGTVLKTTDGGSTWQKTSLGSIVLDKIYFIDNNIGFVGGTGGALYKTPDGGATWNPVTSHSTGSIYSIYFVNTQVGYICGQLGYIAKTIDGGDNWTPQISGVSNTPSDLLLNIKFADADHGFVIGESISGITVSETYILHTTDGGANWTLGTCSFNNITLSGLSVIDATHAYIAGGVINPAPGTYYILKTEDGQNWTTEATGSNRLAGLYLLNASKAFSVGLNGIILKGN